MRVAYLDCYSGISGDMTLGAFLDAGLSLDALRDHLALLDLDGYRLSTEPVTQASILGTRLTVHVERPAAPRHRHAHGHDHHEHDHGAHRHWSEIRGLIEGSRLPAAMKATALRVFGLLAEAEGAVHGMPPDEVHFHEVGAVDSIVDIVGAAVAIELLGVERLYAAPLPLGHGFVDTRHGRLPLPAPATLEVIARTGAATRAIDIDKELVTPTGAAIAGALATFAQPPLRPERVGYGYGTMTLPWPNALRLWLGDLDEATLPAAPAAPATGEEVLLETNIDDMPGEVFGYLMDRLFEAGALDVFYTPIFMKKNRPAVQVSVIASANRRADLERLLLTETTTFGVRCLPIDRVKSERRHETVETPYGPVRRKRKEWQGELLDAVPEYDDCARLARERGVPFRTVYEAARRASATDS
jgi:uncharacterized protein (TIGR00299 family) protein